MGSRRSLIILETAQANETKKWPIRESVRESAIFSREGFCRNPRGIFPTEFPGEFCRGFFVDFFGPFSLEKIGGKNPPKNPRQFSNQNSGVSGPKSTLQGSGLDIFGLVWLGGFQSSLERAETTPTPKSSALARGFDFVGEKVKSIAFWGS